MTDEDVLDIPFYLTGEEDERLRPHESGVLFLLPRSHHRAMPGAMPYPGDARAAMTALLG